MFICNCASGYRGFYCEKSRNPFIDYLYFKEFYHVKNFQADPCDFLTTSCNTKKNSNQNGAIIGGVVGGFFLLLLLIAVAAIIFFIFYKRKITNNAIKKSFSAPAQPPPRFLNLDYPKEENFELSPTNLNYIDVEVKNDVKESYLGDFRKSINLYA